jgi:nucleoside-diphosphate-sugar epimerase
MRIILTGITGNIGYEVARMLLREGHEVIPVLRSDLEKLKALSKDFSHISNYIHADLEHEVPTYSLSLVDCIVHCAGVVHFKKAGNSNELMMKNIVAWARTTSAPIYYVSTAYIYKPHHEPFFNQYESDKNSAELVLAHSLHPHTILRPSIVTGTSDTGHIIHFSGYYLAVPAFVQALKKGNNVRFPRIQNTVNIIPVDWVARAIIESIQTNKRGTYYITNTHPPTFAILLNETLQFFSCADGIELVDVSFEEYRRLDLTPEEKNLLRVCEPFIPYLTTSYDFPGSLTSSTLPPDYIPNILHYAQQRMGK